MRCMIPDMVLIGLANSVATQDAPTSAAARIAIDTRIMVLRAAMAPATIAVLRHRDGQDPFFVEPVEA